MSSGNDNLGSAFERIAANPAMAAGFSFERTRRAGTPALWEERVAIAAGAQETFETVRSAVDDGEEPIGRWSAPATAGHVARLATALQASRIWTLASGPVSPGQTVIEYRYTTDAGAGSLVIPGDSKLVFSLMALDNEVRGIANALCDSHSGAELVCRLSLVRETAQRLSAGITLVNDGNVRGFVPNPMLAGGNPDDFLRIEVARPEAEQPGVTSMGLVYSTLPLRLPAQLDAPWSDAYLLLEAHSRLELPVRVPLRITPGDRFFVRAVVSCYSPVRDVDGVPVLRGRAFSRECDTADLS